MMGQKGQKGLQTLIGNVIGQDIRSRFILSLLYPNSVLLPRRPTKVPAITGPLLWLLAHTNILHRSASSA